MVVVSLAISAGLAILVGILILIWPGILRVAVGLYLIIWGILQYLNL